VTEKTEAQMSLAATSHGDWSRVLNVFRAVIIRPELTALIGTVVVFAYFALTVGDNGFLSYGGIRNFLVVAAEIGIIATCVTLLLVAGEFDLSVGVVVGATGVACAYVVVELGWHFWGGILVGVALAMAVGLVNGLFIVKMGFPSFLVTLSMMFLLRGASLGLLQGLTGRTQVFGIKDALQGDPLLSLFTGLVFGWLPVAIIWWVATALIAAYVLNRTRFGNWIYAAGGDRAAAAKMGVPVDRVKILLFIATSISAFIVSLLAMMVINQADLIQGGGKEFEAITAAVIGGAAMSGGIGSPIGTFFGAMLIGMVSQGFFYTDIANNWYYAFVGTVLMVAVVVNKYSRQAAMRRRIRS
jgi:simple sugar transport system permease protein